MGSKGMVQLKIGTAKNQTVLDNYYVTGSDH